MGWVLMEGHEWSRWTKNVGFGNHEDDLHQSRKTWTKMHINAYMKDHFCNLLLNIFHVKVRYYCFKLLILWFCFSYWLWLCGVEAWYIRLYLHHFTFLVFWTYISRACVIVNKFILLLFIFSNSYHFWMRIWLSYNRPDHHEYLSMRRDT